MTTLSGRLLTTALLFTLLTALVLVPDLLWGLDQHSPFVQLVSFRPLLLAGGSVLLVVLAILVGFRRRAWPFAAGLAVVLLVGGAPVLPRVLPGPVPTGGTTLTVLSLNVFEGQADVDAIADLIRTERPDLIAFPEAGARFSDELAPLIEPLGYRLHHSDTADTRDIANVAAAVGGQLGEVQVRTTDQGSSFPYVEITGGRLGTTRFMAYHSAAPLPLDVGQWRTDLAALARWCAGPTPAIVAGDFNATLDHSAMRAGMAGCEDAAAQRGDGLVPTWGPSSSTRLIGPQIDHVIATTGITAETFSVHDIARTDHRAVLTRLQLPGPGAAPAD